MKRYIALLRGINISGKNKISMSELKKGFVELGFEDVVTYLNSGNVVFSSDVEDTNVITDKIVFMIKERFRLEIPVFVIWQAKFQELLNNAPAWWGNDNEEIYDNIIFLIPPFAYEEFYDEIGKPKEEYEKVYNYKNVVFWSFSRKHYQKTNWWSKTASVKARNKITIRTAKTVKKIMCL